MYTIQARKKHSKAWTVYEIEQELVPYIERITKDENLHKYRDELMEYFTYLDLKGAFTIRRILEKNDKVQLKKH